MIATIKQCLVNLYHDEEGASGIEYALIAAMVAVVLSVFVTPVGNAVKGIFQSIQNALVPPT